MKREDYGTTEQFVTAFRQHVQVANRQNTPISPYSAALLLTEALKDELPIWVETVRYNFRATVASDMSDNVKTGFVPLNFFVCTMIDSVRRQGVCWSLRLQ